MKKVLLVASRHYEMGGHGHWQNDFIRYDQKGREFGLFFSFWEAKPVTHFKKVHRNFKCNQKMSLVMCAQFLRDVASDYDVVMVAHHWHDPVPGVAFSQGYGGPPVVK